LPEAIFWNAPSRKSPSLITQFEAASMTTTEDRLTQRRAWTFLTNHTRVLVCVAGNPQCRLRDIAERIGITERSAQDVVNDLEDAGYLIRSRVGRRNHYTVIPDRPLRHPADAHQTVRSLIALFVPEVPAVHGIPQSRPPGQRPRTPAPQQTH
jgi:biotin operon repressor